MWIELGLRMNSVSVDTHLKNIFIHFRDNLINLCSILSPLHMQIRNY